MTLGREAGPEALIGFCRNHLAAYKAPRAVRIVADLPAASTGRVLHRALHTLEAG